MDIRLELRLKEELGTHSLNAFRPKGVTTGLDMSAPAGGKSGIPGLFMLPLNVSSS